MTSVKTNIGALLAQKFLRSTSADLNMTQNHVSSGLRVAGSSDDASRFAVAQGLRGDIKSYTAVSAALDEERRGGISLELPQEDGAGGVLLACMFRPGQNGRVWSPMRRPDRPV